MNPTNVLLVKLMNVNNVHHKMSVYNANRDLILFLDKCKKYFVLKNAKDVNNGKHKMFVNNVVLEIIIPYHKMNVYHVTLIVFNVIRINAINVPHIIILYKDNVFHVLKDVSNVKIKKNAQTVKKDIN